MLKSKVRSRKDFFRPPTVLEAKNGIVTKVKRYYDDAIIEVGMNTKSGGEIISLKWDTHASGDMYAEIGRPGCCVAISSIALPDVQECDATGDAQSTEP